MASCASWSARTSSTAALVSSSSGSAAVAESRRGAAAGRELDLFLYRAGIKVVDVSEEQALLAREAWRRYGKGRHPAGLKYGDLFSYALARAQGDALLFKGDDFAGTDVTAA